MLRKYSRGTFRNSPRNHASMNAHARSVRKSTFRNFPSSCRMLLRQRILRFSAQFPQEFPQDFPQSFRRFPQDVPQDFPQDFLQDFPHKVSAGLSAGFPHRCVRSIVAEVLENLVPSAGPQGRRVLRGPSTLQKVVRQTAS